MTHLMSVCVFQKYTFDAACVLATDPTQSSTKLQRHQMCSEFVLVFVDMREIESCGPQSSNTFHHMIFFCIYH